MAERPHEVVELRGHILDSGLLGPVLDEVMARGADHEIIRFDVGRRHSDVSYAAIRVEADSAAQLWALVQRLQSYGANPATDEDVELREADRDGVFPEGFYCTTNLPTRVRVAGRWLEVDRPEMDCGIVVDAVAATARTICMDQVRAGMSLACGLGGIKVTPQQKPRADTMSLRVDAAASGVSPERPHALMVQRVADGLRAARAEGGRILWVAGPALVHTGSVEPTCALIRAGYMDVLFAGNALAAHDIEGNVYGTALGVSLSAGVPGERGHEHHVRAINRVRRAGGIRAAVADGTVTGGIMWHCVRYGVDYVLAGSVRDDGPLPDVIRDVVQAQAEMRRRVPGVGFALMVATQLHSVAAANLLPADVPRVCVDINPAAVGKLVERGAVQSVGLVTDVGLFLRELAHQLAPDELREIRAEHTTVEPTGEPRTP